jgi:hypothetical protein
VLSCSLLLSSMLHYKTEMIKVQGGVLWELSSAILKTYLYYQNELGKAVELLLLRINDCFMLSVLSSTLHH